MALSGRAGSTKLRGRIDGGFEAPARARLEGVAPFGKPVFIFVADGARATLVLPRDDRVLADAPASQIIEALTGVALDAEALRTIVAGCGFGQDGPPSGARRFSNGWVSAVSGNSTVYLRPDGTAWQVAAASRESVSVFYESYASGHPATVRIRAESNGRVTSDLLLRTSQVDVNTPLDPRTFDVGPDLPSHPVPLTIEELRRSGPLGGANE